jgi:nitrite reductase (NADH) small subunit
MRPCGAIVRGSDAHALDSGAMSSFQRVASAADLVHGRGRAVLVAGQRVALFLDGDRVHAIADACPHMGASLADGRLEDGAVTCPWHGWRYDAASGKGLPPSRPWACVRTFEVKLEAGHVFVRVPDAQTPPTEDPDDDPAYWDAERWFRKREE